MDVNNFFIKLIFTYKNKNQLKINSKYVFEFMLDIFSKRVWQKSLLIEMEDKNHLWVYLWMIALCLNHQPGTWSDILV